MAISTASIPPAANAVSGKVILKESSLGIPDLLVVVYDSEPPARAADAGSNQPPALEMRSANLAPGSRIGSVLTAADGSFAIQYADDDFRAQHPAEARPTLTVSVLGPEDPNGQDGPAVLFQSRIARRSAGRAESFLIRLGLDQLKKAGINPPKVEATSVDHKIQAHIDEKTALLNLNKGIADFNQTVLSADLADKKDFADKFKKSVAADTSLYQGSGVFVPEGGAIRDAVIKVTNFGIDSANDQLGDSSPGVPVNLYLTPDDRDALKSYFQSAVGGIAQIPESLIRPILFRANSSENIGTLLTSQNPILKYCREKSSEQICAEKHLKDAAPDAPGSGDGNVTGTNVAPATEDDVKIYMARLLADMPSPDEVLAPSRLPSRPTPATVADSIGSFSLEKGPAEVAAYYDFNSLQIAFDHVWQQLFDEDVINSGFLVHQKLLVQTGVNLLTNDRVSVADLKGLATVAITSPISQVPVNVAAHFDITKEEWTDLGKTFQDKLREIADKLDDSLTVTVHNHGLGSFANTVTVSIDAFTREKFYQKLTEQGERLIDSVRHDDYYSMHQTLRDLHDRLNAAYEYTVFGVDKNDSSVNFGLLNTYRQQWLPLNYQVGRLCKTIPLAPKEERKYSYKVTRHTKQSEKNARKNNTTFTGEQHDTSRVEAEIVAKAQNKITSNLTTDGTYNIGISKGDAKASLGADAASESQESRKDFREAVLKATQEYKDELSSEVTTEDEDASESNDSGTILNPNDELAVTFLFYELQRRYRISEQLYRVLPVVMVAQPVPQPHEITEAWVIANDWILSRFLLDDSFKPALTYLANKSVGDDFALRELRRNLREQRNLVASLQTEFASASLDADNKYRALLNKINARIDEQAASDNEGFFTNVAAFFGSDDADPDVAKAREQAASDEHKYAVEKAEKIAASLKEEVNTLHKLTADYNQTLRTRLDEETRVARLLLHLRSNILYYMQAIWSMEPPDQRFLRLQKVQVPDLQLDGEKTYRVEVGTSEDLFAAFRTPGTEKHKATVKGKLRKPFTYRPLVEIANLDQPLGFKGNYMIFPMREHNALTEFMATPYIDSAFGAMDPDELSNVNLDDFSRYVCCLYENDRDAFERLKPTLNLWLGQLLADPLRNGDELIVPTGSLYIEALPSAHALLEDFKLKHRELDVVKAGEETRKLGLENLRYALRLLRHDLDDPDIEKKIVIEGASSVIVPGDQ